MYPKYLIDLHCDTLTDWKYTSTGNPDTLDDPKRVLSLSAMPPEVRWAQFYAIFIPDEVRSTDAVAYYERNRDNFVRQMGLFADRVAPCAGAAEMEAAWAAGKTAAFLTVENGSALNGKIERVQTLANDGVRCMTIVWNGENEIGSGHTTDHGLSAFGREAVAEMERCGMLVDVSHLNDAGFADLFALARRPFIATHSNARSVCSHKRNLTDDMIHEMVKRGCLIGLNYYINFLADGGAADDVSSLMKHVEHFFALGAEKNLALGSDFDGAKLPGWLNTPAKAAALYGEFIRHGLTQEQAEGIMYANAQRFFRENL